MNLVQENLELMKDTQGNLVLMKDTQVTSLFISPGNIYCEQRQGRLFL